MERHGQPPATPLLDNELQEWASPMAKAGTPPFGCLLRFIGRPTRVASLTAQSAGSRQDLLLPHIPGAASGTGRFVILGGFGSPKTPSAMEAAEAGRHSHSRSATIS